MAPKFLTQAQEEAIATQTIIGGHKHWAEVKMLRSGTAIVTSRTGKVARVTRDGKVLSGKLPKSRR